MSQVFSTHAVISQTLSMFISQPSDVPSISSHPSIMPSAVPSTSAEPSSQPSLTPTDTMSPSSMPSQSPSLSSQPSSQPSVQPTKTAAPSSAPSNNPTSSGAPTLQVIIKFTRCAHDMFICLSTFVSSPSSLFSFHLIHSPRTNPLRAQNHHLIHRLPLRLVHNQHCMQVRRLLYLQSHQGSQAVLRQSHLLLACSLPTSPRALVCHHLNLQAIQRWVELQVWW